MNLAFFKVIFKVLLGFHWGLSGVIWVPFWGHTGDFLEGSDYSPDRARATKHGTTRKKFWNNDDNCTILYDTARYGRLFLTIQTYICTARCCMARHGKLFLTVQTYVRTTRCCTARHGRLFSTVQTFIRTAREIICNSWNFDLHDTILHGTDNCLKRLKLFTLQITLILFVKNQICPCNAHI